MSENKIEKKYTVKEFCEKYNETIGVNRIDFIKSVILTKYIPYETKISICNMIIENAYYQKNNEGTVKFHVNTPIKNMLYRLNLINLYTNININFSNALNEFNKLNECNLFNYIIENIPDHEQEEFDSLLNSVESDLLQNTYEIKSFISSELNRFGEIIGRFISPALLKLSDVLENMTEEDIDKILNKISKNSVIKKFLK